MNKCQRCQAPISDQQHICTPCYRKLNANQQLGKCLNCGEQVPQQGVDNYCLACQDSSKRRTKHE